MTIFAEINQKTMKKILLLILSSLVLFAGCKKDGPQEGEPVTDGYEPITKEVTCACGAVYSVTCKRPPSGGIQEKILGGNVWISQTAPTAMWEVLYKSNDNAVVPFDELLNEQGIKFNCQAQGCNGVMECYRQSFKPQEPDIPDFPFPML